MSLNLENYLLSEEDLEKIENKKYRNLLSKSNSNIKGFFEELNNDKKVELRIISAHKSGTIDLPTLNNVTKGLQRVYTTSYNFKSGNHSIRGKISEKIKKESSLLLTNTKAGSFILEIERNENSQLTLEEEQKNNFYILDELFQDLNKEKVKELVQNLGFRTLKNIKEWYQELNKHEIEFVYNNSNSSVNVHMDKNKVQHIAAKLESIEPKSKNKQMFKTGKIKYVDHNNNTLIFIDEENEKYKIKVIGDTFKNITIETNIKQNLSFKEITKNIEGEVISNEYEIEVESLITQQK